MLKRIRSIHTAAGLLFMAAAVCAGKTERILAAPEQVPCVVTAEGPLNVHRSASEESEVIGKIYHYGTGTVLKTAEDGKWVRIRSGLVRGYVSADYLAVGEEAESLMDEAGYLTAKVTAPEIHVYDAAAEDANVIASEPESVFLDVLGQEDGWIQVRTPYGMEGWVPGEGIVVSTSYSTAESLKAESDRLAQEQNADETAAEESALWLTAQEALMGTAETKVPLMEAQMALDEALQAFLDAGGSERQARNIEKEMRPDAAEESAEEEETGSGEDNDTDAAPEDENNDWIYESSEAYAYRDALQKVIDAQAAADVDEAAAQEKVEAAERASVKAQAAEKVAVEAARRAPRGAAGAEFVTTRDHTIYFEPSLGQELVNYACQFVGNPYVWGGESLTNGCDCSGFTMLIYARYGIELPHFAESQATFGTPVEEEDLEPGDLVFYQNASGIHHVAIYIGNGTIVHAANSASGICFSAVDYSSNVRLYRRLLKEES